MRAVRPNSWWYQPEHEYLASLIEILDARARQIIQSNLPKRVNFGKRLQLERPRDAEPDDELDDEVMPGSQWAAIVGEITTAFTE